MLQYVIISSVYVQKAVTTLKDFEIIQRMMKNNNGFITTAQVTSAGIQRRVLSELVAANLIYRATRGIYVLPEAWEDEMFFLQHRYSKGIFSNETALYLHGLSDQTPQRFTLTFPHGYNASGLKDFNAIAKFASSATYELGIMEKTSPCGNPLRVYDVERTLCDVVKGNNNHDAQLVNQAMKFYAESSTKDIAKLMSYADRLRVKPKILKFMEVLL
jgi:predicted transcriptional regulator of viral defense system